MKTIAKMAYFDWLSMKAYHKLLLVFTPYCMLVFGVLNTLMIVPVCVVYHAMVSTWPFSVEEKGESHKLYLTLPLKKREIVAGRYFVSLIVLTGSIIIGSVVMLIKDNVDFFWFSIVERYPLSGALFITAIAVSCLLYAFVNLCVFPMLFWLGFTKGKFLGYAVMFSFFFIFAIPFALMLSRQESPVVRFINSASENLALVNGIFFAVAAAFFLLSYFLSVKVYSKRDF
jgi:ABC-type transport system involved in multi-copper enzyme maturation permease subunit